VSSPDTCVLPCHTGNQSLGGVFFLGVKSWVFTQPPLQMLALYRKWGICCHAGPTSILAGSSSVCKFAGAVNTSNLFFSLPPTPFDGFWCRSLLVSHPFLSFSVQFLYWSLLFEHGYMLCIWVVVLQTLVSYH
jgi:hypothetical protein